MKILLMHVNGMTCDNSENHVLNSLSLIPGVSQVEVDLMSRTARVEHDEKRCSPRDLVMAVQRAGFQVDGFESLPLEQRV